MGPKASEQWTSFYNVPPGGVFIVDDLTLSTQYIFLVTAHSNSCVKVAEYEFATKTSSGDIAEFPEDNSEEKETATLKKVINKMEEKIKSLMEDLENIKLAV